MVGAVVFGFWQFHEHQVSRHLDSAQREYAAKIESREKEFAAKTREQELTGQAALSRAEDEARREKESRNLVIENLRQKLSTSRSTLEISVAGEFISIGDLLLDEVPARELLAAGGRANIKRLLVPEYQELGWTRFDEAALAQVMAFVQDSTLKLRPDGVSEDLIEWQPILTLWAKETKHSVGVVAVAQLTKEEFVEFLRRGSTTTSTIVTTDKEGRKFEQTETRAFEAKKIEQTPIGIAAYAFLFFTIFDNSPFTRTDLKISSFSARTDAMHFAGTVDDGVKRKYATEFLIMQDGDDTFLFLTASHTRDALDPVARETSDWMRGAHIVRKPGG